MTTVMLTSLRGARPLLILWLISPLLLIAQKYDYLWQFGNPYTPLAPNLINILDFKANPPAIDSVSSNIQGFGAYLSMADSAGNLAFFSNGLLLYNFLNQPIIGSDSFNFRFNQFGLDYGGALGKEGSVLPGSYIALPWPDSDGVYVILHQTCEDYPTNFKAKRQYYTVVDMHANNGQGQATKINQILLDKYVETGQASACRHSNGRDWWVLIKEAKPSNAYHRFLLTPTGWHRFEDTQEIGEAGYGDGSFYTANGVVFSNDGQRHIRGYDLEGVYVFDFDRCTGLLSNYCKIPVLPTSPTSHRDFIISPAISPSGKYLYICNDGYLIRYDLDSTNVATTRDTVAIGDGFTWKGLPTIFGYAQLAPDGKIYINTSSTTPYLQVISQPDSADPMVQQHHVLMPSTASGLPIYPNYRLGQVPGNPCPSGGGIPMDTTVGVDLPLGTQGLSLTLQPNPATESVNVRLNVPATGTLVLRTLSGLVLLEQTQTEEVSSFQLDLQQIAAGVYVLEFEDENGVLIFAKLCVQ